MTRGVRNGFNVLPEEGEVFLMVIDTIHTGYGDPTAPEGSLPQRIAEIEDLDKEYAEVGLDLPEEQVRHLAKLVATLEALRIDLTPRHSPDIIIGSQEGEENVRPMRRPMSREPEFIGAGLTGSSDSILAA